ncbi:MAG: NYN domain-containing protein [Alphaproteobacteria bacterium]|nr:NYN domain-containing protein [Alphaproteobacteria bacterium]MDA8004120.1 NYN domain-containing protein [Alphaproteobacteria bacterium]MDA8005691.1 NYN domain-containing protein [Alphaproteobacteria bacterium]MDA8013423.1 NYN domain-containing protein [Alphaproteobacteria bacterium]
MKARIYIDGLNLYYGCLKDTPYRWLNCEALCRDLLKEEYEIVWIKYFISSLEGIPNIARHKPDNQRAYLRALNTLDKCEVILGYFQTEEIGPGREPFLKEKASDVNLAVHLLHDAHENLFDAAVVVSRDNDFVEAVRLVQEGVGKKVGVFSPGPYKDRMELFRRASFIRPIRPNVLRRSLFARDLEDAAGEFHMPAGWDQAQ